MKIKLFLLGLLLSGFIESNAMHVVWGPGRSFYMYIEVYHGNFYCRGVGPSPCNLGSIALEGNKGTYNLNDVAVEVESLIKQGKTEEKFLFKDDVPVYYFLNKDKEVEMTTEEISYSQTDVVTDSDSKK